MLITHEFRTEERQVLVNLTASVQAAVTSSGVREGICLVYCPHTTAAVTINSYLDEATAKDILHDFNRLVPTRVDFFHTYDTPSDAAGHIKATLTGLHLVVIIHDGQLLLGGSQGILFAEFDGPRQRKVHIKIVADPA